MKFTKIIISLISVCIFFSSCYVVRMPEENSEEEIFTDEMPSEETYSEEISSDNYFHNYSVRLSKPDVPKIDFKRDFCVQVKNNYIINPHDESLNFAFVDEQGNCYIQRSGGKLICYDIKSKKTVIKEGIKEGCYTINGTIYYQDTVYEGTCSNAVQSSLHAIKDNKDVLICDDLDLFSSLVFAGDKLYFSAPTKKYNGEKDAIYQENTLYCLSDGSTNPQKISTYTNYITPYLEYNNKFFGRDGSFKFFEYDIQNLRYFCLDDINSILDNSSILTVIDDYVYFWDSSDNYIIQYNAKTREKIYCKSPFLPMPVTDSSEQELYYRVDDFNFTDSYFFFVNNDKIVRTDLDFENRTELDLNIGELYSININKNRIFISYFEPNTDAIGPYYVAEIDKDGKVLKIFE